MQSIFFTIHRLIFFVNNWFIEICEIVHIFIVLPTGRRKILSSFFLSEEQTRYSPAKMFAIDEVRRQLSPFKDIRFLFFLFFFLFGK